MPHTKTKVNLAVNAPQVLARGETKALCGGILDPATETSIDVNSQCTFTSSYPTLASVDATGLATGAKPGSVTFQATYKGQSVTADSTTVTNTRILFRFNETSGSPNVMDASGHHDQASILDSNHTIVFQDAGPNAAAATSAPGHYAMTFNGQQILNFTNPDFAAYPANADGPSTTYAHSVEVWFKTAASGYIFGQQSHNGTGWSPAIYVGNDGKVYASLFYHGQSQCTVSTGPAVNDNNWHQVVVTFQAGTETLYVDGVQSALRPGLDQTPYTTPDNRYQYSLGYGMWNGWPSATGVYGQFNGSLSEFAFFDYALTAADVATDYANKGIVTP